MKSGCLMVLTCLLFFYGGTHVWACSMYKITADGKTMVGCNHDTWLTTPKIWFENAKLPTEYGAGFTGARQVGQNRTAPQSGMNEKGLVFSRLVAYYPNMNATLGHRLEIDNEVDYLTDILHTCASVEEVKQYIEQYDHSFFSQDVFIYIDSAGSYLIVEPYTCTIGNQQTYVLSNFCPSITDNQEARQLIRYKNGEDFLNMYEASTSLAYCSALSDTMHVCRDRNGDGTLLTSIWDTKDGTVNLYFYHNFEATVQFNLAEALSKGDHLIDIPNLFPNNSEFERLKSYKTPFNTPVLRMLLVAMAGLLLMIQVLLMLFARRISRAEFTLRHVFLISVLNLSLIGYLFILATNEHIYYFDAPYQDASSHVISVFSYTPFLLILAFVPFCLFTIKRLRSTYITHWIKATLAFSSLIYVTLILGLGYWGLYSFWN